MTTATKSKVKIPSRKVLSNKPVNSTSLAKSTKQEKAVGLIALWNAPSPGLFKDIAEVDAHIREGRGEWDEMDD
jgi:hypothetical protein